MDPDGGYTGIVIKINKDVPEDLCPQILSNLKVSLSDKFSHKCNHQIWILSKWLLIHQIGDLLKCKVKTKVAANIIKAEAKMHNLASNFYI